MVDRSQKGRPPVWASHFQVLPTQPESKAPLRLVEQKKTSFSNGGPYNNANDNYFLTLENT